MRKTLAVSRIILISVPFFIGTLYDAARRRVVARCRNTHRRPVRQSYLPLHQPFAETRPADYDCSVPVLQRSGDDFARRGRTLVNHHHHSAAGEFAPFARRVPLRFDGTSLSGYDCRFVRQEETGNLYRCIHQSAAVAAQVEHERFRTALLQASESIGKFGESGAAETVYFDVTNLFVNHIGCRHGVHRDVVTRDSELQRNGFSASYDTHFDGRTARPAKVFRNLAALHSDGVCGVYSDDSVVGAHADGLGRTSRDGVDHYYGVSQHVKLYAYAAELACDACTGILCLLGVEVCRMRVEFGQHLAYGGLHQRFHIHVVDIQTAKIAVDLVQFLPLCYELLVHCGAAFLRGRGQRHS